LNFQGNITPIIRFTVNSQIKEAQVLDLSNRGMRLCLTTPTEQAIKPDTTIHHCTLILPGGSECSLPSLRIAEINSDSQGQTFLRLQSDDDVTNACLWTAVEAIRTGRTEIYQERSILNKEQVPRVPARGIYSEIARQQRLSFAQELYGIRLDNLNNTNLQPDKLTGNIENLIGGVEIPVGLAGPLLFHGQTAKGFICAPYATTEGALVASTTRGALALSRSGGVTTRVISQRMQRVPMFVLNNMDSAFLFASWIHEHADEIRQTIKTVSSHAKLISITPNVLGNMVHVVFLYETGDAAGQNMTTACTWHACQWLMKQMKYFNAIKFDNFIIEANLSGDKKVSYKSFISGRGTRVTAECFLPDKVLQEVLKVTAEQLLNTNQGVMAGSMQAGMIGYNINIANTIAAIFTATGQDIACVHESSIGQLHMQPIDGGVYASLLLPSVIVGTVGGGTQLPQQNELLQLMDCSGLGKVSRLAEIIAGFCLALDLSTLSAVASGLFATAHERLGRNRPVDWFVQEDLSAKFFLPGLRKVLGDESVQLVSADPKDDYELGSSIITELTARKVNKLVGLFPYHLVYKANGKENFRNVIVKVKPLDKEVILMINSMASMCGPKLASKYREFQERTGFLGCHTRELEIYKQSDPRFTNHMPTFFEAYQNDEREAYVLVIEQLENMELLDTADDPSGWDKDKIETALSGAASFHSVWYGREKQLIEQPWLGEVQSTKSMTEMIPLWEALGVHAAEEFPEWITQQDLALYRQLINSIPSWWADIEKMPRTLIHNDFNPRNICLRKNGDELRLCAYDWELATLHLPQHDLAELLCFVLSSNSSKNEIDHYIEYHRQALQEASGQKIETKQWRTGYLYSLYDLAVNRVAQYIMAHTFRHYSFMERVVKTMQHLIKLETNSMDKL
jgi:NADP-dependent 3-hydroxy-3-methylglutaryl-CoA reductase